MYFPDAHCTGLRQLFIFQWKLQAQLVCPGADLPPVSETMGDSSLLLPRFRANQETDSWEMSLIFREPSWWEEAAYHLGCDPQS